MQVQTYLFFDGRCEEAFNFYHKVLGAEKQRMMRFKDSPEPPKPGTCDQGSEDKIMHMTFRIGETTIMASDGRCQGAPKFEGFSLSVIVPTPEAADRVFGLLADGGQVQMPLSTTFFSPRFGMLVDRFGVSWMILVGN